jgi:hypothetical protein
MIHIIKFLYLHEFKWSYNFSAKYMQEIFNNLDDCLIIYKYKISSVFIWQKFGTSDPDKIDFNKIKAKSIILYHLNVYENKPEKIKELLDWCLLNKIDIYLPTMDIDKDFKIDTHICSINNILKEYKDSIIYDLSHVNSTYGESNDKLIFENIKPILREIRLKKLLNG